MSDFPPKMIVCVGSVVLHESRVLFVRQTYGDNLKGKWSIPWGYVQGETPETYADPSHVAAIREVREEAGVTVKIQGLLGIQHADLTKEGIPRLYILYLCDYLYGEPTPDHYETDQAIFFSEHEMDAQKAMMDPFCYWMAKRVLTGDHTLIPANAENPYSPHLAFL
ncbi:MAG: NUDIX domain-containing protein [Anaerolineae bacterium]|jgi:8-oxo-dGTP pyrophosphatase MutT (NUDIX family)|nr:NUDIX domain-containing protein [Anaerolineae bacterium]